MPAGGEAGRMIRPALSYTRLPAHRRAYAREAAGELAKAWTLVRLRSFASYSARLGQVSNGEQEWDWSGDRRALVETRWAVRRWNDVVGGRFTCLMQAMAGQAILRRRGIESAVVLGLKVGQTGGDPTAHAWLRVGQWIVLGGEVRPGHVAVASYR